MLPAAANQAFGRPSLLETHSSQHSRSRFPDYNGFGMRPSPVERPTAELGQEFGRTSNTWGNSNPIFNPLFGSQKLEKAKPQNQLLRPETDSFEPRSGSASLVQSSEADVWPQRKSQWDVLEPAVGSQTVSKAVTPNPRTNGELSTQLGSAQPYYKQMSAIGTKPQTSSFDAIAGFGNRSGDGYTNGSNTGRGSFDTSARFQDYTDTPWTDNRSTHSPVDIHSQNLEPFGPSSAGASRNGSLPPSRHGNESFNQPQADRFTSLSSRPAFQENSTTRPLTQQTTAYEEALNSLARLGLDNGVHGLQRDVDVRRPSTQYNSTSISPTRTYNTQELQHDTLSNSLYPSPNTQSNRAEQYSSLRQTRFNERNTILPSSSGFQPNPFFPDISSPPVQYSDMNYTNQLRDQWRHPSTSSNAMVLSSNNIRRYQNEPQYNAQQYYVSPQYQQMLAAQFRSGQFANPMNPYAMYQVPSPLVGNGMMQPVTPQVQPNFSPTSYPNQPRNESRDIQSSKLREFHANTASRNSRKVELKEVYGHVVEFSGDQVGSRFLQQKLEQANSDEKATIYDEIFPNAPALMADVFGNYVIQKLFEHCDMNQKTRLAALLKGNIGRLSMQMYGCRVVQKAFEHILVDQQAELVQELNVGDRVMLCLKDQNGNHVVQKAIEVIPSEHIQFIYEALLGQIVHLSTHAYGCRVVQRMLEKNDDRLKTAVLRELAYSEPELIMDQFGNYVAQHVITHGDMLSRNRMIELILRDVRKFARHKFASNVVEKCIVHGTLEQQLAILNFVVEPAEPGTDKEGLIEYVKCGFGNYVIQTLLDRLPQDEGYRLYLALIPEVNKARRTTPKKTIDGVEDKMKRFFTPASSRPSSMHSNNAPALAGSTPTSAVSSIHTNGTAHSEIERISAVPSAFVPSLPGISPVAYA